MGNLRSPHNSDNAITYVVWIVAVVFMMCNQVYTCLQYVLVMVKIPQNYCRIFGKVVFSQRGFSHLH